MPTISMQSGVPNYHGVASWSPNADKLIGVRNGQNWCIKLVLSTGLPFGAYTAGNFGIARSASSSTIVNARLYATTNNNAVGTNITTYGKHFGNVTLAGGTNWQNPAITSFNGGNLIEAVGSSSTWYLIMVPYNMSSYTYILSYSSKVTLAFTYSTASIRNNVNGVWKMGNPFYNVSGVYRQGIAYTNVSGVWKQGG